MTKNWRRILLCLLSLSGTIHAAVVPQRDTLSDIEKTQRLLELRQQQEYINQQLMYPNRKVEEKKENEILNIEDGKKYLFKKITLEGSNLYEKETITGDEFMAILSGNKVQAEAKPETAIEAKEADDNEKTV